MGLGFGASVLGFAVSSLDCRGGGVRGFRVEKFGCFCVQRWRSLELLAASFSAMP